MLVFYKAMPLSSPFNNNSVAVYKIGFHSEVFILNVLLDHALYFVI